MQLKVGVKLLGVLPQTVAAMWIVDKVYQSFGQDLIVTNCSEGKHKRASAHYTGRAFDARTRFFASQKEKVKVKRACKKALGQGFDVILEKDHIHIEWDPKGE